jgi:hypothetical protein
MKRRGRAGYATYNAYEIGVLLERTTVNGYRVELRKNDCGIFVITVRDAGGKEVKKSSYSHATTARRQYAKTA